MTCTVCLSENRIRPANFPLLRGVELRFTIQFNDSSLIRVSLKSCQGTSRLHSSFFKSTKVEKKLHENIHSLKLTFHQKIGLLKRKFIFQPLIFRATLVSGRVYIEFSCRTFVTSTFKFHPVNATKTCRHWMFLKSFTGCLTQSVSSW